MSGLRCIASRVWVEQETGSGLFVLPTFAQCWTLDATGNWKGFREDDIGDDTWDRVQSRTANGVNEIANISASAGPTPITPTYSPAGNMTTIPTTGGLDWNNFTLDEWDNFTLNQWDYFVLDSDDTPYACHLATYDAWNRLVKLVGQPGTQTVAEYAYDGVRRQIRQKNYEAGTLAGGPDAALSVWVAEQQEG